MANKNKLTGLFAFLACVFTAAAIAAVIFCRGELPILIQPPQEAARHVGKVMDAVCAGDFAGAQAMLRDDPDLGADRTPSTAVGQMIWEAYLESLDYELVGSLYATDTGLAQNVKIISLELSAVTEEVGSRARALLNATLDSAETVSELYDKENNYREDLIMDLLHQAVREALEEDVRYGYEIVPLQLVFGDGCWHVVADQNFIRAVSGGLTQTGAIIDMLDMYVSNVTSDALEGILSVEKVYWLQDEDLVAPRPNPENYGETEDPGDLETVIRKAEKLLDGQKLLL